MLGRTRGRVIINDQGVMRSSKGRLCEDSGKRDNVDGGLCHRSAGVAT